MSYDLDDGWRKMLVVVDDVTSKYRSEWKRDTYVSFNSQQSQVTGQGIFTNIEKDRMVMSYLV